MLNNSDRLLISAYLGIAAAALIGTWTANITFLVQESTINPIDWLVEAFTAGPVSLSLSIDILAVALAAFVFMWVEARRLAIRWYWVYVVLSVVVAVSVFFPVFMAARQRRMAALRVEQNPGRHPVAA